MYTGDDCEHVLQRPILSLYHILLMIAIDTPVCYTEPMKKTVVILCGLLLVSVALYGGLAEQLVMFVLIGRVPFTNLITQLADRQDLLHGRCRIRHEIEDAGERCEAADHGNPQEQSDVLAQ